MTTHLVELHTSDWRLRINPSLGGCVLGLWLGNTPVLRTTAANARHADQTSAYALVPYSNRIGQAKMVWEGHTHVLKNGFNAEPHALHGVGFMRPWSVLAQTANAVCIGMVHEPDDHWPFAFSAQQRFELFSDGLRLTLSACNRDDRNQPMGLGWHPYFERRTSSALNLPVHTQWLSSEDLLTQEPHSLNGLHGEIASMQLDHCFTGTGAVARLSDPSLHITLEADSNYWVVYTPQDAPFFCVEPVTHLNNAVQHASPTQQGLVALNPGESLHQTIRLRAQCAS